MFGDLFSLSGISGVLCFVAFVPYIMAILRGKTKPAKASWIIWPSVDAVLFAGMWVKGSVNGQIIGALSGALVVTVLAFKFGRPGWTWTDKACLVGLLIGITLWQVYDNPLIGIAISSILIVLGGIPTVVASWNDPGREDKLSWTLFWLSCVFALLAVPKWDMAHSAQPISFTIVESAMMYVVYIRPLSLRRSSIIIEPLRQ